MGGRCSQAVAVNDRGQVVGEGRTADDDLHAFLWDRGTTYDLGAIVEEQVSGAASQVADINDAGQILGRINGPTRTSVVIWTIHR